MSRWRPPQPPSSPYISAGGYARLQAELKALWERRTDVVRHLAAAAAEGDRSENAEYQYRKKELRGIDARIGYLQRRLPVLKVVSGPPPEPGRIFFGAQVELEDGQGALHTYRVLGSDEIDAAQRCISLDSPLARVLLGKTLDDEFEFPDASGRPQRWTVLAIEYPVT